MQLLTDIQHQHAVSISKRPIWVLEMLFTNGVAVEGVNDFYFATADIGELSDGAITPLPAANRWYPLLDPLSISAVSQQVDPITGVSSIGNLNFKLVDVDGKVSNIIAAADSYKDAAVGNVGYGLNRQFVNLFVLYAGDNWDDRLMVRRLQIVSVQSEKGIYSFACQDIQRAAKKTIFEPHTGSLSGPITVLVPADNTVSPPIKEVVGLSATSTSISLTNLAQDAFTYVAGYSHIKIGDEIMQVIAKPNRTASFVVTFQVQRGVLGTAPATHQLNDDASEVVRLFGDPLSIGLQVLTGNTFVRGAGWYLGLSDRYFKFNGSYLTNTNVWVSAGSPPPAGYTAANYLLTETSWFYEPVTVTANAGFPEHWHCGMSLQDHIEESEWDATRFGTAVNFEFVMGKGEDGKLFVEREIMQPLGLFMRVKGNGKLGVRLYDDLADDAVSQGTGIAETSNGDYRRLVLDADVVISFGKLEILRKGDLMTSAHLAYDPVPKVGGKLRRNVYFLDPDGFKKHGKGRSFKMGSRGIVATDTEALNSMFGRVNRILQRFSRPPMRLQVQCLPKMAALEIGDKVRVKLPVRDPYTGLELNRRFEILKSSLRPKDGVVSFDLIAQSELGAVNNFRKVSSYADSAFLNGSTGTALTLAEQSSNKNLVAGDYYAAGDYTISGNWTINGTVRIFCSGILTITGTLDGKGRSNTYHGYASAGGSAEDGWFKTVYELTSYLSATEIITESRTITSPSAAGTIDGTPLNISPSAFVGTTTKVATALQGLPEILSGATGAFGAYGVMGTTYNSDKYLRQAMAWAVANNHAMCSIPHNPLSIIGIADLKAPDGALGGAGLLLCARRVVLQAGCNVDLSGATAAATTELSSGHLTITNVAKNDYATHTFKAGKAGSGGGGSLLCIAESGFAGGIHINQQPKLSGGDNKAGGGQLKQELL